MVVVVVGGGMYSRMSTVDLEDKEGVRIARKITSGSSKTATRRCCCCGLSELGPCMVFASKIAQRSWIWEADG